jgi:hypothetical protein
VGPAIRCEGAEKDTVETHEQWSFEVLNQDFGLQPLSRLEVVAQYANEQEADCNHAAIMF